METLYIKIDIEKSDVEAEEIRNAGLLFQNMADAVGLNRVSIEEIDERNWVSVVNKIKEKYSR